jgi:hypothetical protein
MTGKTGRTCGSETFVQRLEDLAGKGLRHKPRGRKP